MTEVEYIRLKNLIKISMITDILASITTGDDARTYGLSTKQHGEILAKLNKAESLLAAKVSVDETD